MNLQEMVVTNAEGKIRTEAGENLVGQCIQSEDMYSFYAIKDPNTSEKKVAEDQKAAKVRIMMPLGGELNGMYRFPRVGEKVLVAVQGTVHYLMGYLPAAETPFAEKDNKGKEKTEVFDKEAQVMRYKKTGDNTSDNGYSEIGFYSETTEWKEKEGKSNSKTDEDTNLPIVDKIKLSSSGDIETRAQNYNEVAAKRIGFYAGYDDDVEKRKAKQKQNLKAKKTTLDLEAFPVLPQDYADQDPSFFSGDIQMRAKKRIVLKAEDTIEIMAGNSMIRMDSTGISLISRKASISAVNAWDSMITVSSRDGLNMFGTKVNINSAYKFSLSDAFGGNVMSMGGITRITGCDIRLRSMCKAAYVLKGVSASASFATNIGSMGMGIDQEQGKRSGDGSIVNKVPSWVSLGAGVGGTLVGVNWGFNATNHFDDAAGGMVVITDFIVTMLGLVVMALDFVVLSKTDQKEGGRAGLTMSAMVAEYGLVLQMFARLNVANQNWLHASSLLMSYNGDMDQSANSIRQTAISEVEAKSAMAGADTMMIAGLWKSFSGQEWWKIVLESVGAVVVLGGAGTGAIFGYKHSSSVNAETRKELEAL
ncbi:MAG: hypothetical protein IJ846_01655 [Alphaproteobacteria bacterium]|nr:hypothetical protein [Alphaproteobacteria bacterium]